MKSPSHNAIVDPSLRPVEPGKTSAARRRTGFALLGVGFAVVLFGCFVSFGQWLFIAGSILIILSLFLLKPYRSRASQEQDDIRKLYGHEQV
jgi:membrane protein implicated in regulation of membrane protease activity